MDLDLSPSPGKRLRLAVVLSHPTQYYSPWFRWLAAHTLLEINVFYLWDFGVVRKLDPGFEREVKWDVDLLSGYESEFVPNEANKPGAEHFWGFRNPSLPRRLKKWGPDAILIFGYKWASHLIVIAWARSAGIPILFRGDSHLLGRESPPLFTRIALGILFSQFSAFLYVGTANRRYFEIFHVSPRKLFLAPHSVNSELFDPGNPLHLKEAKRIRESLGLNTDSRVVLFAGKLVPAKQPKELLKAFLNIQAENTALVFVGDGPELPALRQLAHGRIGSAPARNIFFLPFANQSEMPARYLLADLFVLPSRGLYETWGLAVNEAMHMGVPCLVSDRVGCQQDLVVPNESGWVFDSSAPESLARTLAMALNELESVERRMEFFNIVRRKISGFTYRQTTKGLLEALRALPSYPGVQLGADI